MTAKGTARTDPFGAPRRWESGLPVLRLATQRQVPALTRDRRHPPLRRTATVVGRLVVALGTWAVRGRRAGGSESRAVLSAQLRLAAESLGPTYLKLCQIISSGEGIFPKELVDEMKKCRDQVPPQPWETVERIVSEELGGPLSGTFSHFDHTAIAAASIAQVHAATLLDGTEVVVKVQREGIGSLVHTDLQVMSAVAPLLVGRIPVTALANPPALVELFAETICEELDFRLEAENMVDIAGVFAALGEDGFVIPRPHRDLVTRRMLVMERLRGFDFDDVVTMRQEGIDTHEVVRIGLRGFTAGCMIHGIFHGDLHGGNLLVLPDGKIGLLDFGICARMTPLERIALLRLVLTGSAGDIAGQVAAFRDLGALPDDTDIEALIADLGLDQELVDPTTMDGDELVAEIQRVIKALMSYGAKLPKVLMLYVKNLVFLDGAIATLAPDLDLIAEFVELSTHLTTTYGAQIVSDLGADVTTIAADPEAIKASFGIVDPDMEQVSYRDLQERRELIRRRLSKR